MSPWRRKRGDEDSEPAATNTMPAFAPVNPDAEPPPMGALQETHEPYIPAVFSGEQTQSAPTTETIDPRVALGKDSAAQDQFTAEIAVTDDQQDPRTGEATDTGDRTDGSLAADKDDSSELRGRGPFKRRSGRNMTAATVVGLGILILVLTAAWFHPLALAIVVYSAAAGAIIEWRRALAPQGRHVQLIPMFGATAGMALATWNGLAEGLAVAVLIGCVGVVAWRVADERIENSLADSLASMLTLLWIPFLVSFFLLMAMAEGGWVRVVIVVLAIVGNDSGGLYAGMLWGKHKMAPRISPKKTIEGGIGGVVLGTGVATAAAYFLLDGQWWIGAMVGFASTLAAVAGDLAESIVKRDIQIKDMSHAIPGHGGIMDRLDSALFAAPVAYLIFAVLMGTT